MLVLESIQQRAFGFLHLTRSPRHGMHSSARQRAFWMPEKQQLVQATDAKRGHGFLFLCFEWRPWRHNKLGTTGEADNTAQAKSALLCCWAALISILVSSLATESQPEQKWRMELKNKGGLWADETDLGYANHHLQENSTCFQQGRLPGECLQWFCWWFRHLRFSLKS